jgi:hypothetical protein
MNPSSENAFNPRQDFEEARHFRGHRHASTVQREGLYSDYARDLDWPSTYIYVYIR